MGHSLRHNDCLLCAGRVCETRCVCIERLGRVDANGLLCGVVWIRRCRASDRAPCNWY